LPSSTTTTINIVSITTVTTITSHSHCRISSLRNSQLMFLCNNPVSGVWLRFSRHLPNWRVVQYCHSPSQKSTG
jgi:hypothetical protein